jgi:hypothetical protein
MQHHIKNQQKASHLLNKKNQGGTKFKLFVQPRYLNGFEKPETIRVSLPPEQIKKGPSDERIYVVDIKDKLPYGRGCPYRPQFFNENGNPKGEYFDPPKPNSEGHYDEIDINSRHFLNTTMYATIRFGLDIWESYAGPIEWITQKENSFEKLELIPLIDINNALAGRGYLEFGYGGNRPSSKFDINEIKPYCENFDVLCHELGHNIIYSLVGSPDSNTSDFGGFHESAGDIISIITSLHFDTMVDKLLNTTKGNLFSIHTLGRLAELSNTTQIRNAFNNLKMSDVSSQVHDRSEPLTGALFDVMVEVYQFYLVKNRLINENLAKKSINDEDIYNINDPIEIKIQEEFGTAYIGKEKEFKKTLLNARDYLGKLLVHLWKNTNRNEFTSYSNILKNIIQIENDMSQTDKRESYANIINDCFEWREIYLPRSEFILPRKVCTKLQK